MLDLLPMNPFGRLTAIRPVRKDRTNWVWLCECACGATCEVNSSHLRRRSVKSCGCLRKQRAREQGARNRRRHPQVAGMIRLREQGFTYKVMSRLLGMSASSIQRIVSRANIGAAP